MQPLVHFPPTAGAESEKSKTCGLRQGQLNNRNKIKYYYNNSTNNNNSIKEKERERNITLEEQVMLNTSAHHL